MGAGVSGNSSGITSGVGDSRGETAGFGCGLSRGSAVTLGVGRGISLGSGAGLGVTRGVAAGVPRGTSTRAPGSAVGLAGWRLVLLWKGEWGLARLWAWVAE